MESLSLLLSVSIFSDRPCKLMPELLSRDNPFFCDLLDGANVAYYGHGLFRYSQVQKVVEELERMGERPLVIMPQKYAVASFRLAHGVTQKLNQSSLDAMAE